MVDTPPTNTPAASEQDPADMPLTDAPAASTQEPADVPLNDAPAMSEQNSAAIIIDHRSTKLSDIPESWIEKAKQTLRIAYGHTSHGSQLVEGMTGLVSFAGPLYEWKDGGVEENTSGALDLRDSPFPEANDLGSPDRTIWADATRSYLNANPDINVIIWSWCGEVSDATEADIDTYLSLMSRLEADYPNVRFVYMTGHLDGSGAEGNLNRRNEQIRVYAHENNKILYDFADIESYDPDGAINYMVMSANDACDYDADGDGSQESNWARAWQSTHIEDVDWYQCGSAHSEPLVANMKAYAAWALWARLAGWSG
ncbi:MAG: hypothetical protein JXB07_17840 [Anaerolineae bacterium]|nr:hypothetical protein [Anaerolineae bacterium]